MNQASASFCAHRFGNPFACIYSPRCGLLRITGFNGKNPLPITAFNPDPGHITRDKRARKSP
jgi:hypothetical protein